MNNKKNLYVLMIAAVCILIGILIGALLSETMNSQKEAPKVSQPQEEHKTGQNEIIRFDEAQIKQAGIVIEPAEPRLIGSLTKLNGEIKFNEDRTAHVVPRLAGIVESVPADMGQQVKKGDVLAVIASTQLAELRSELLGAQKRRELATITYEREKKLWEEKISSEQDYLQAQERYSEASIALQNVTQKLSALGATSNTTDKLSQYALRAPFDGMVVEKHIAQGEAVKEDTNVFTVSDLSTVWAEVFVPAQDLDKVRVGEKALVQATAMGSSAEGTITFVSSLFGEQTRTAKARVTLKNPNMAWRPGLFVNIDLINSESEVAVAVLSDAIQSIEERPTIFVQVAGGFIPQTVVLGRSDGKYSEIVEGIKAGTPYAAAGSFVIKAEQGKSAASQGH